MSVLVLSLFMTHFLRPWSPLLGCNGSDHGVAKEALSREIETKCLAPSDFAKKIARIRNLTSDTHPVTQKQEQSLRRRPNSGFGSRPNAGRSCGSLAPPGAQVVKSRDACRARACARRRWEPLMTLGMPSTMLRGCQLFR